MTSPQYHKCVIMNGSGTWSTWSIRGIRNCQLVGTTRHNHWIIEFRKVQYTFYRMAQVRGDRFKILSRLATNEWKEGGWCIWPTNPSCDSGINRQRLHCYSQTVVRPRKRSRPKILVLLLPCSICAKDGNVNETTRKDKKAGPTTAVYCVVALFLEEW